MSDLKTKRTSASVAAFLNAIEEPEKRRDAKAIDKLMREVTGEKPVMWGASIIGYGSYHYEYASGRTGDWMLTGFSPRKQALTLYIMSGLAQSKDLLEKLGEHKTGKACLYIKRLSDVDFAILRKLVTASVAGKRGAC